MPANKKIPALFKLALTALLLIFSLTAAAPAMALDSGRNSRFSNDSGRNSALDNARSFSSDSTLGSDSGGDSGRSSDFGGDSSSYGVYEENENPSQLSREEKNMLEGTMLGAVLGQQYTGLSIIDFAAGFLLLLVTFRVILHFSARKSSDQDEESDEETPIQRQARDAWARLYSHQELDEEGLPMQKTNTDAFDQDNFLDGAKTLYKRLQESWATREINVLENFLSPLLFEQLKEQARLNPEKNALDILLISPTVLEHKKNEPMEKVKVLFEALIQEGSNSQPVEVREIWNFSRNYQIGETWHLEEIEPAGKKN